MPSPASASDNIDTDRHLSSLSTDSHGRRIIPLSPRPGTSDLPEVGTEDPQPHESSAGPTMLLDYVSRLSRYEPRLRRYAARRISRETGAEPISAFAGAGLHSSAQTPISGSLSSPKPRDAASNVRGFSLVDLERALLSVTPEWWKGLAGRKSRSNSPDGRPVDSHGQDGARFDVDLSQALGPSVGAGEPSATDGRDRTSEKSLQDRMPKDAGPGMFLSYYSSDDLISTFEKTGLLSDLAKMGYKSPSLIFDTSDEFQHRLSLVDASLFMRDNLVQLRSSERFLIDLFMKRRRRWDTDQMVCYQLMRRVEKAGSWEALRDLTGEIRAPFVGLEGGRESGTFIKEGVKKWSKQSKSGQDTWDVTEIAWMQMHNPFSKDTRPLLPGQRFPGLGLGRKVGEVMEAMAKESKVTDALLNFPFYWHLAVAYSIRGWRHLDPVVEAYVEWITSQVSAYVEDHGLSFVAWAISLGHLRRVTEEQDPASGTWTQVSDRLERWSPSEQLFATSEGMRAFIYSEEWEHLHKKWRDIFERDGGANGRGVGVIEGSEGASRRAKLVIDLEGCPECWKYSKIWSKRDPETGDFR